MVAEVAEVADGKRKCLRGEIVTLYIDFSRHTSVDPKVFWPPRHRHQLHHHHPAFPSHKVSNTCRNPDRGSVQVGSDPVKANAGTSAHIPADDVEGLRLSARY